MPNINILGLGRPDRQPVMQKELPLEGTAEIRVIQNGVVFDSWDSLARAVTAYGTLRISTSASSRLEEEQRNAGHTTNRGRTWYGDYRRVQSFHPDSSIRKFSIPSDQLQLAEAEIRKTLEIARERLEESGEAEILPKKIQSTGHGQYNARFGLAPEVTMLPLFHIRKQGDGTSYILNSKYVDRTTEREMARFEGANPIIETLDVVAKLSPTITYDRHDDVKTSSVDIDFDQVAARLQPIFGESDNVSAEEMANALSTTDREAGYNLGDVDGFSVRIDYGHKHIDGPNSKRRKEKSPLTRNGNVVSGNLGKSWYEGYVTPDLRVVIYDSAAATATSERREAMVALAKRFQTALQPHSA